FITKLKPRQFNWDRREWYEEGMSDGSKMKEEPTAGFIAQEFDEIQKSENAEWLNLVLKDNPDKWEATYGNLLPVMVKAIQELSIKNEKLEIKNANLEERLEKYEEMQIVLVKKIEELESGDQTSRVQIVNAENSNQ
ncbi:MAG: tail fiber domain-containing protein, partial [Ignavibacteriaceae bacterium]|nr:tail fiber domain-containing protein [Ignavibacteriaceae bacterium]